MTLFFDNIEMYLYIIILSVENHDFVAQKDVLYFIITTEFFNFCFYHRVGKREFFSCETCSKIFY